MNQSHLIALAVRLALAASMVGVLSVPPVLAHYARTERGGHGCQTGRQTGQAHVQPWAAPCISTPGEA